MNIVRGVDKRYPEWRTPVYPAVKVGRDRTSLAAAAADAPATPRWA